MLKERTSRATRQKEAKSMPHYVVLMKFTQQGLKTIKDSPARADALTKATAAMGGKLDHAFVTMGQYDYVLIGEAPSDEAAAAMSLVISSGGNVTCETLRAFTQDEFAAIVKKLP
jgi:uncharacterized protein with GYD domain